MKNEQVYVITQSEYDILTKNLSQIQNILAHAKVVDPTTQQFIERRPIQLEKLSTEKMQELFGKNYQHLIYYSFDTSWWNKDTILGWKLLYEASTIQLLRGLKDMIEATPEFKNLDVVAIVNMPIVESPTTNVPTVTNPKPAIKLPSNSDEKTKKYLGCNGAAGTIVCRDKCTGKLQPVPDTWIHIPTRHSLRQIPNDFAKECLRNQDTLNSLIKIHTR